MLRAASNMIVVTPTGNNSESEKGRLIVVRNPQPADTIYRGVVQHVGRDVREGTDEEPFEPGCVAHYTTCHVIDDETHVVPHQNLVAWEPR